ncbi:MAG: hypothetical protein M3460_06570 [Actinomycetota bacterium]|nr:hypothetical protein [Actinomycetota bacterium]
MTSADALVHACCPCSPSTADPASRSGIDPKIHSDRAGHFNPTVTFQVYTHRSTGQDRVAAQLIDQLIKDAVSDSDDTAPEAGDEAPTTVFTTSTWKTAPGEDLQEPSLLVAGQDSNLRPLGYEAVSRGLTRCHESHFGWTSGLLMSRSVPPITERSGQSRD